MIDKQRLEAKCSTWNITLTGTQLDQLDAFAEILVDYNQKVNLTAITDPEGIEDKHFLDSLLFASQPEVTGRMVDVGAGAGFPGMNLPRATRRAFEIVKHRKKLQPMEELKLYEGRPADCTGRLEKEIRTYDLLDKLGIQFWRTDHGWMKADTMEDCHVIDACLNATVCKNLFLCNRQKTNFYLLMMPGDKPFKTKELSHQLGIARLSFASPEDMEQYLDCTPGSSSIMGLANDAENKVQLLMDEDIKAGEYLGCHPCINTSSLKLRTADVLETFLPAVHHEPIFVQLTGE